MKYPSKVGYSSYGKCLFAKKDLPLGTIVEQFKGIIVSREKIPIGEICYAILIENDKWMIPISYARYLNHSCNANCRIDDNLNVITIRSIKNNEELTISYNIVYENENPGDWNPYWTFICLCGAKNCQGIIDKYITPSGKPWISKNITRIIA
ncbi:MAG: SET domain-containing protein-lysine N-methyltransferase [Promethearchaeota archaeon]